MSLALLNRQPITWDSEAASYLTAVETADAQSLEPAVARAINSFVIDCKIRGIWGAIKSSCLLCGPRTQAGAVVPLKGNAPILTSFIGNYTREVGLQRVSGSFDINRNNNADPTNNKHIAVYPVFVDASSTVTSKALFGSTTDLGGSSLRIASGRLLTATMNSSTSFISNDIVESNRLIGISIQNNSVQVSYNNKSTIYSNITLSNSINSPTYLYDTTNSTSSSSIVSFYSVGESINLNLLSQAVQRYINNIRQNLLPSYSLHSETSNWITRVSNNSGSVSQNTINAINWVCHQINNNALRNIFLRLNLFCGNNINSALVPLYIGPNASDSYGYSVDINFNNVDADYNESGSNAGFIGVGAKWVQTGVTANVLFSVYSSGVHQGCMLNNITTPVPGRTYIGTDYGAVSGFGSTFFLRQNNQIQQQIPPGNVSIANTNNFQNKTFIAGIVGPAVGNAVVVNDIFGGAFGSMSPSSAPSGFIGVGARPTSATTATEHMQLKFLMYSLGQNLNLTQSRLINYIISGFNSFIER